jgi:hypothetical protein
MIRPVVMAGVAAAGRRDNGSAGGFRVAAGSARAAPPGLAAEGVVAAGLLALQEWPEDRPRRERDQAARRHGEALLAALAGVQRDMLADRVPDLERLAILADTVPEAADSGLRAAMGAVALRARIELARWGSRMNTEL